MNEQKKVIIKEYFLSLLDILFIQEDCFQQILKLKKSRKKDKEKIAKDITEKAFESLKKIYEDENSQFLFLFNELIKNEPKEKIYLKNIISFSTKCYENRINENTLRGLEENEEEEQTVLF